jgi:putative restriction endonuclease
LDLGENTEDMKFWVGVTDKKWFEFLRARAPDEVNFWQPSARRRAAVLDPGAPFLFKLHAPSNFIVGGGFYVRYSALPARVAWDAFGVKNGVADYGGLRRRVEQYRAERVVGDPEIGCNVLNRPFFWSEQEWVPVPATWARNIVQGKSYSINEPEGRKLWDAVAERLQRTEVDEVNDSPRFGADYLTHARLGQGAFRVLVTDAYRRRCAITGERTLPVLEAAHIRPYTEGGPHLVSNGLLLRSDLHTLLDRGYMTVTDDFHVEVSPRIRQEFENGREYYKHHGQTLLSMPQSSDEQPSRDSLRWHNETVFLASVVSG